MPHALHTRTVRTVRTQPVPGIPAACVVAMVVAAADRRHSGTGYGGREEAAGLASRVMSSSTSGRSHGGDPGRAQPAAAAASEAVIRLLTGSRPHSRAPAIGRAGSASRNKCWVRDSGTPALQDSRLSRGSKVRGPRAAEEGAGDGGGPSQSEGLLHGTAGTARPSSGAVLSRSSSLVLTHCGAAAWLERLDRWSGAKCSPIQPRRLTVSASPDSRFCPGFNARLMPRLFQ